MKHFAFFSLAATLLLTACVDHEEYEFAGRVLWVRNCTPSYLDNNMGYVVKLDYPDGMGADIVNDEGDTLRNLIVLYEPTSHIRVNRQIHGTFYLDNKYSRANCQLTYDDYELPEGVFTKSVEDKQ